MADVDNFKYNIKVLDGGMALAVTLMYVPRMSPPDVLTQQLIEDLNKRKVVFGLDEDAIKSMVRSRVLGAETIVAPGCPCAAVRMRRSRCSSCRHRSYRRPGPDGKVDFQEHREHRAGRCRRAHLEENPNG